jgi:hypothetical protein
MVCRGLPQSTATGLAQCRLYRAALKMLKMPVELIMPRAIGAAHRGEVGGQRACPFSADDGNPSAAGAFPEAAKSVQQWAGG